MIAVYPGTFDPITNGHVDVIERASKLSKRLIVAILDNVVKVSLFTAEERLAHIRAVTQHLSNVEVVAFHGLQVDLAKKYNADVIIRGLRSTTDFDQELIMALGNRCMSVDVETLFMPTSPQYSFLSSSLVKEIITFGGDVSEMVPPLIVNELKNKMK